MNYMKIRKVTRTEKKTVEAISGLLPQLTADADRFTMEALRGILASKGVSLFLAEDKKGHVAGMLTLAAYQTPTGLKMWVEDVVVDAGSRGKGYGKELMLFAIGYARTSGAQVISLTSRPSRIAANELYSSLGFKKCETNFYKYKLG
jgi:ribosomal protein S18 acetylase RimI-like enzyme